MECTAMESLAALVPSKDITIRRATVSKTGVPIITTSNQYSYTLNSAMKVWMRVADDAFARSEFRSSHALAGLQQGPLAQLQV
jgi:hypothetical protein